MIYLAVYWIVMCNICIAKDDPTDVVMYFLEAYNLKNNYRNNCLMTFLYFVVVLAYPIIGPLAMIWLFIRGV